MSKGRKNENGSGSGENSGGNTRDANAAIRAALAVKLRAEQRLSYAEIARQCGFASKGAAHNAVQRELARTIATNVEELRREELATLDYLEAVCLKRMRDETHEKALLFAVDRILQISERRARLLGLDAPTSNTIAAAQVVIREVPQGVLQELQG